MTSLFLFIFSRQEIRVFFCGPSVLSHVLHNMSDQYSDKYTEVKFCYNKENFYGAAV